MRDGMLAEMIGLGFPGKPRRIRQPTGDLVDDVERLADRNLRFIEAWRQGSWPMLEPIVSRSFCYLDGATGEAWNMERYIKELTKHPDSTLVIDQVVIRVDGDTAVVSARSASSTRPGHANRYVDTYARSGDDWLCVHACVWPLPPTAGPRAQRAS